jgi:hypothetical protein
VSVEELVDKARNERQDRRAMTNAAGGSVGARHLRGAQAVGAIVTRSTPN